MADLVFVAVTLAFFGLAVLLVRMCERIIGGADAPAEAVEAAGAAGGDGRTRELAA